MKGLAISLFYILINLGIYSINAKELPARNTYQLLSVLTGLVLIGLFLFCRKKKYAPLSCFVPVALVLGLLYMAVTPALRTADEELHFFRAYEVSMGHAVSDTQDGAGGRALPKSLRRAAPENTLDFDFADVRENLKIPLNPRETEFIAFPTAALYSPVQYLPQAIGILAGRLLGLPPLVIAYLGRLSNFLLWLLLCYLALRNFRGSSPVFLFMLLPMVLHTAASLSPDALTNSLSLLFLSVIVKSSYDEQTAPLGKGRLVGLCAMAVILSLCKIVYLPLCLLLLLVPKEGFASRRGRAAFLTLSLLLCAGASLGWLSIGARFLTEVKEGVDGGGQLAFILSHPVRYVVILARTTAYFTNMYLHTLAGANLCLFDVPVYYWVSDSYLALTGVVLMRSPHLPAARSHRLLALFIFGAVFALINTSLYIQWTKVGSDLIDGIQGRYFLPLLPLTLFLPWRFSPKSLAAQTVTCSVFLAFPVLLTLLLKHMP